MTANSRLAVLSYHSWEISPATLEHDIVQLRSAGWTFVRPEEAMSFVGGSSSHTAAKLVLLTTDDGHAEDAHFLDVLQATRTPGVTFITLGRIDRDRRKWYADRAHDPLFAIEDHGAWHRRVFASSRLFGFVTPGVPLPGLEHMALRHGSPLFVSTGEVSGRQFTPDAEAIELCVEEAISSPSDVGNAAWCQRVERRLVERRLARRVRDAVYLAGRFESPAEFARRVRDYLSDGCALFRDCLGRAPSLYGYTWWQGSQVGDNWLRELGYRGSFSGTGFTQLADRRPFAIPRVPVDEHTSRPLSLDRLPHRPRWRAPLTAWKAAVREALGIR